MKTKLLFQQIKLKSIPHEMTHLKTVNLSSLSLDKIQHFYIYIHITPTFTVREKCSIKQLIKANTRSKTTPGFLQTIIKAQNKKNAKHTDE